MPGSVANPFFRGSVVQGVFPQGIAALHNAATSAWPPSRQAAFPKTVPPQRAVKPIQPQPHPTVQRRANATAMQLPQNLPNFGRGPGQRLPDPVRQKMESFFSADFSGVRIHVGSQARSIGALAFTHGSDIYFAPGQYNPATPHGQKLLGHELTHVLQQRAGRVRNPFGSGIAVVQDGAMEAEAEHLGMRAAAHRMPAQAAPSPTAVQRSTPVPVLAPVRVGKGSYRIAAGAGSRQVGSVMVHERAGASIEVTDLGVEQAHRKHGLGGALLASAARTGMRMGKTKVTLASQDKGSGRLTNWYKRMGFMQVGVNRQGFAQLEAPINRVLSVVHTKPHAHSHFEHRQAGAMHPAAVQAKREHMRRANSLHCHLQAKLPPELPPVIQMMELRKKYYSKLMQSMSNVPNAPNLEVPQHLPPLPSQVDRLYKEKGTHEARGFDSFVTKLHDTGIKIGPPDDIIRLSAEQEAITAILKLMGGGGGDYGNYARELVPSVVSRAIKKGYNIHYSEVLKKLRDVIIEKASMEYNSQMSQYKGDWRGGGFFNYN